MRTDIETTDDVKVFVDAFYEKVRADDLLAPVFASRVEKGNWQKHLNRMYAFWGTVLLFQRGYKGNPFAKHVGLNIDLQHFNRWVMLFKQTIDQHFSGEKAKEAKRRADNMGAMFSMKLKYLRNNPNYKSII